MSVADDDLERAAAILRRGGLVAFPTETVYGLGANALDREAVLRIYAAKERPAASPLIVHIASLDAVKGVAAEWPDLAHRLAEQFWPGPLTLVVRKASQIPDEVTAGLETVGIRMPRHPVARELIWRAGIPIAAPSANRFTHVSPTTAEHVRVSLGDRIEMILDGGPCEVGIESTVLSLAGPVPLLLRPGMLGISQIAEVIGPIAVLDKETGPSHLSPGLHPRHYSPKTPLYLLDENGPLPKGRGKILELNDTARVYAAQLYSALHAADRECWDWIAVKKPPETPEWAAIRDRLQRASTKAKRYPL
ncbi:MAG: L-threonylcarbamoyladenylate synthase [Bryobacteraceae bacterium]